MCISVTRKLPYIIEFRISSDGDREMRIRKLMLSSLVRWGCGVKWETNKLTIWIFVCIAFGMGSIQQWWHWWWWWCGRSRYTACYYQCVNKASVQTQLFELCWKGKCVFSFWLRYLKCCEHNPVLTYFNSGVFHIKPCGSNIQNFNTPFPFTPVITVAACLSVWRKTQ